MIVQVRFHAELDSLVAPDRRGRASAVEVGPGTTVKDLAEGLGVPHTEIEAILVNGRSVGFDHRLAEGDRVGVYPVSETPGAISIVGLQPPPLPVPRFVLDVHLGRLARHLRLLGFDAAWRNDATDGELASSAHAGPRILLTRDRGLLKRGLVTHGYLVRATAPRRQVVEVLRRFGLADAQRPFGRCLECNGLLEPVPGAAVARRVPPGARGRADFRRCAGCGRVYWRGSHYDRLRAVVEEIRQECAAPGAPSTRRGE